MVAALSVLLAVALMVDPLASVEALVAVVAAVVKVVASEEEPLSVADPDSVAEPLSAPEVENIVLVARVVVTTVPSLLVKVETISVVEIGTRTPVPEVSLEPDPLDRVVVPTVVGTTEPSLFVTVEMISDVVTEAVVESELPAPVVAVASVAVAETVMVGDETAEESGVALRPLTITPCAAHQLTPYWMTVWATPSVQTALAQSIIP